MTSLRAYLISRTPSPPITFGHFLAYPHPPPQKWPTVLGVTFGLLNRPTPPPPNTFQTSTFLATAFWKFRKKIMQALDFLHCDHVIKIQCRKSTPCRISFAAVCDLVTFHPCLCKSCIREIFLSSINKNKNIDVLFCLDFQCLWKLKHTSKVLYNEGTKWVGFQFAGLEYRIYKTRRFEDGLFGWCCRKSVQENFSFSSLEHYSKQMALYKLDNDTYSHFL